MTEKPVYPQLRGRAGLIEYSKAGRTTKVDWEMLVGERPLILFSTSIQQWNDGSTVSDEERAAIINDIRDELRPKFGEIEIDDPRYQ
jgi:hypothetical protein